MVSPASDRKKVIDDEKVLVRTKMLSTGIEATIKPVGATLIDDIVSSVPAPKVPMWHNPDKDRDEENPNDPQYLEEVAKANKLQATRAMEALLVFGVDVDVPEDNEWLKKLRYMEKRGALSLDGYDVDDPLDRELVYKKYIAVGTKDLIEIGMMAGLNQKDVDQAARQFRS